MFQLVIKRPDGSIYWTEYFNSMAELNRWLEQEKTRDYWKSDYTTEIKDNSPKPPSQAELDEVASKNAQIKNLKQRVKALTAQADMSPADVKEALMKFLKMRDLMGDLE